MKKIYKIFTFFLVFLISITSFNIKASKVDYVYLGGDSIGLKMNTGVYVVGKYQVQTKNGKKVPWNNTNIEIGDLIINANGIKIENNSQLNDYIKSCNLNEIQLEIKRNNQIIKTNINLVLSSSGEKSIGLYVRDQILGIGTLTFITQENKYASLGHGIYEKQTLLSVLNGNLYNSIVQNIKKSEPGSAGEKRASLSQNIIGNVIKNDTTGLYGTVKKIDKSKPLLKVAKQQEVSKGFAKIYTVLESGNIEEFIIEIIDIDYQKSKDIKGIKFKVVDEKLIQKTGGIIQGMSGSPIVQNNMIVGAVSHVTVDNPLYGYGMHIEWMIKEIYDF